MELIVIIEGTLYGCHQVVYLFFMHHISLILSLIFIFSTADNLLICYEHTFFICRNEGIGSSTNNDNNNNNYYNNHHNNHHKDWNLTVIIVNWFHFVYHYYKRNFWIKSCVQFLVNNITKLFVIKSVHIRNKTFAMKIVQYTHCTRLISLKKTEIYQKPLLHSPSRLIMPKYQ
jgi:hypothetical protein